MANNSYIIDPLTGEKIYHDPNRKPKKNEGFALDPLTGQSMSTGTENLPLFGNESLTNRTQGTVREGLSLNELIDVPLSPNRSLEDSQDIRANNQSTVAALGNSLAKSGVTLLGATADNTIGGFIGLGSMAVQGEASAFYDNFWGQSIDEMNNYMQENFPVYETQEQQGESLSEGLNNAAFWDKVFNGAAYSMASAISIMIPGSGLSKLTAMARKGAVKQAANALTNNAAKVLTAESLTAGRQVDKGISFLTRSMKSAIAESGVEARETKNELKEKLTNQLIAEKGADNITQEDYEKIDDYSDYAANANFATNLAVVGGSNFVTFGSIVRGNSDDVFNAIKNQITKKGGKSVKKSGAFHTATQVGKGLAVDGGTEAAQEGTQYASNIAYQDYYSNKHKNGETASLADSFSKGMHETLNSKEGLESMLIGALVGGGMSGFKGAKDVAQNLKGKVDPAVERSLEILNSKAFETLASKIQDENTVNGFKDEMIKAAENNDQKSFNKSFHNMLMADVRNNVNQGTEKILLEKLEELQELPQEEFNKYFGIEGANIDPKTAIASTIETVNKGIEIAKNMDYLFEPKTSVIEKLASQGKLNSKQVEEFLKDRVFQTLANFEYINNEEAKIGQSLEQETDGKISYNKNVGINNDYLTETNEQFEEFLKSDKFINDSFLNSFFSNPAILSQADEIVARSKKSGKGKFKNRKDVLKHFFFSKNNLSKKQGEFMRVLEDLKSNNQIRPDKKEKIAGHIKHLQELAVEREISNVAFRELLDLETNQSEMTALITAKLNEEKAKITEAIKEQAAQATTKTDKDTVQAKAATLDAAEQALEDFANIEDEAPISQAVQDQLSAFADEAYADVNDARYDFDDEFNDSINEYVDNHPEVLDVMVEDFNDIISRHDEVDSIEIVEDQDAQAQLLAEKLEQISEDSATKKNLQTHIDNLQSAKDTEEVTPPGQTEPAEVEVKTSELETQNVPVEEAFDETQSLIITLTGDQTIKAREAGSLVPSQDENITILHSLDFGQRGTDVLFEYPDVPHNKKGANKTNPVINVYTVYNGEKIIMGVIGGKATKNTALTKEIYSKVLEHPLGTTDIDLGIVVDEKWAGRMQNQEESYNPAETQEKPMVAVVLQDKSGNIELFTNGLKVDIRVTPNIKKYLGHTFMLVPSAAKNISGETIYYPSHTVTKTLKDIENGPQKVEDVLQLIVDSKIIDENGKKSVDNKREVNKSIFLNYFVEGDFINISSRNPAGKGLILTKYNKNLPEDLDKLRLFLGNSIVKIDYLKINSGTYNADMLAEGRLLMNLDKENPLYDTRFVLAKKEKEVADYDLTESDVLDNVESNTDEVADEYADLDEDFIADLFDSDEAVVSLDEANTVGETEDNQSQVDEINKRREVELLESKKVQKQFNIPTANQNNIEKEINTQYNAEIAALQGSVAKARVSTTDYERGNNEEELAWLKKRFPNTPVSVIKDLNRVAAQGKNAWGLFLNGAIYLKKNFSKGTAYHEAFHAVFNSYMNAEERQDMYTAAQGEWGTFNVEQEKELRGLYPNLDPTQLENIWLEEQLAEEYRRHVLKLKGRSIAKKISDFFKKLYKILTFTTDEGYMKSVFSNIDNGKYGKRPINYRFTNIPMYNQKLGSLNFYESREATELIDRTFQSVLDVLSKKYNTRDEIKLLNEVGVNKVYAQVFNAINAKRKEAGLTGPKKKFLGETLRHFKNDSGKIGATILNHKRYYKYRYKINLDKNEELDNAAIETAQETSELPNWIAPTVEKNGKDTLSIKLKRILYRLHSEDKDIMGYKKYVDYDSLYNTLERKLSGLFDIDSFEKRMQDMAILYPSLKELNNKFKKDPQLFSQFYHHFGKGQNQYIMPSITLERDEFSDEEIVVPKVANLSRVNVRNEVLKNVESYIQNSKLTKKDGTVSVQVAKPLYAKLSAELTRLGNMQNKSKIFNEDFTTLSSLLNSYGVKLSPEDLKKEMTLLKPNNFMKMFIDDTIGIKKIFKSLADGSNPFTDGQAATARPLNTLTDLVADSALDYYQAGLTTTDGKMIHSFVVPNLIHRITAGLNGPEALNRIKFLKDDPSYRNSFILEKAEENIGKEDTLDVVVRDGLNNKLDRTQDRYADFNAKGHNLSTLLMYWNNGNKDSYYPFPELADAPVSYFLRTDKLTDTEDLVNKLYKLFLFEKNRIATAVDVKNYDNKKLDTYVMFPFLNNSKFIKEFEKNTDSNFSINKPASVKDIISYYYATVAYPKLQESLIKSGVISIDGNGKLVSAYLPKTFKDTQFTSLEDFLRKANMATSLMLGEIQTIYQGDPLFAAQDGNNNRTTDMNKRGKEGNAPMKPLDTRTMEEESFHGIILGTTEVSTRDTPFVQAAIAIDKALGKKLTGTIDKTDGQSFTTLQRFRAIAINTETWSEEAEALYPKLLAGTESPTETAVFLNSIKGFFAGMAKDGNNKIIPLQKKDSELPILPSMANQNPVLKMMNDRMLGQGDFKGFTPINQISFDSTIKKGLRHVISTENGIKEALMNSNKSELIMEYPYSNYGIQQPSPAHHLDDTVNFMTQFRKLLISNLSGNYKINGEPMPFNEVKDLFNDIVVKNLQEDYKRLESKLLKAGGDINYKALRKLLVEELENMNYSPDFIEALDITEDGFRLKTWNPKHSNRIEAMMNSFIKNKISRQKSRGGQFINATDLVVQDSALLTDDKGNTRELQYAVENVKDENGKEVPRLLYVEAIMPAYSKEIMQEFMNPDGTLSENMPDELKELVGVRIPTEAKYSMLNIKIVGFAPASAGSQIYLPVQAIKQTGMDFDIDKMFMLLPNFKTTYSRSAENNAYNFIERRNLGKQQLIDELVLEEDTDKVFGSHLKLATLKESKLKEMFIENVLFNSESVSEYKDLFLDQYDNSIESVEYIKPDLSSVANLKSKEQRDNGILEIAKSILSAPQTFREQIKFNTFENLIKLRNDISKENGLSSDVENPILMTTQLELFLKTADAAKSIGVFANNNSSHASLQYENITLENPFKALGYILNKLDPQDVSIADSLGELIAASVDAIKSPVFYELNINGFTNNILSTMLRFGIPMKDAVEFLNTPTIIELSQLASTNSISGYKQTSQLINVVKKEIAKKLPKGSKISPADYASPKDVKIGKKLTATEEYKLLNTFYRFASIADDLKTITDVSKLESNPPGPLMSNNEMVFRAVNKVKTNDFRNFNNVNSMLNQNSNYKMIQAFYEYTYEQPTVKIFNKLFPWLNPSFIKIKNVLEANYNRALDSSMINNINYNLLTYIIADNADVNNPLNITEEELKYLNVDFPYDLIDAKEKYPKNNLIQQLFVDNQTSTVEFNNLGAKSVEKTMELQENWQDLLNDPETRKLGEDLFKFNFISHGFIFSKTSFYDLAPVELFEKMINQEAVEGVIKAGNLSLFMDQYVANVKNESKIHLNSISAADITEREDGTIYLDSIVRRVVAKNVNPEYPLYVRYNDEVLKLANFADAKVINMPEARYVKIPTLGNKNRLEYSFQEPITVSKYTDIDASIADKAAVSGDVNATLSDFADSYSEQALSQMPDHYFDEMTQGNFQGMEEDDVDSVLDELEAFANEEYIVRELTAQEVSLIEGAAAQENSVPLQEDEVSKIQQQIEVYRATGDLTSAELNELNKIDKIETIEEKVERLSEFLEKYCNK